MNILVVGGTGFLGSNIAAEASVQGLTVWVLTRRIDHSKDEIYKTMQGVRRVTIDELPRFSIITKIDVLVSSAVVYGRSNEKTSEVLDCNVVFPIRVLEMMGVNKPKYVINLDTFYNKHDICDYMFWYSHSKKMGMVLLREFCRVEGIEFVNLMLEHVYGPYDSPKKFTTSVFNSLVANSGELDLTEGLQKRDFIYVTDAAQAVICAISNIDSALYEKVGTIEVGSGDAITIRLFVETAKRLSGANTKLCFGTKVMAYGELMESSADIRKLSAMGWSVAIGLEEGIKHCLEAVTWKQL